MSRWLYPLSEHGHMNTKCLLIFYSQYQKRIVESNFKLTFWFCCTYYITFKLKSKWSAGYILVDPFFLFCNFGFHPQLFNAFCSNFNFISTQAPVKWSKCCTLSSHWFLFWLTTFAKVKCVNHFLPIIWVILLSVYF